MMTRREFGSLIAASSIVTMAEAGVFQVRLGAQSYSFRDMPLDQAITGMTEAGIRTCELTSSHMEPKNISREELRKWRVDAPLERFREAGEKFKKAGITLCAYNYSFRSDFSDEEIAAGFAMTKALGAKAITASGNVSVAPRVETYAAKNKMLVGMHNHSNLTKDEFAKPEDFAEAMRGHPHIAINLDIGHFTAAGFDAVDFLSKHAQHIVTLHIKDRKRDQGPNVPFGEGDTPIKEVLRYLRDHKLKIPANIEYEYKGTDTLAEVKKCAAYCRAALES